MKKEIVAAGVMGLIGGLLGSLITNKPARAEDQNNILTAHELRIVDKKGNARVTISGAENSAGISIESPTHNILLAAEEHGMATISVYSKKLAHFSLMVDDDAASLVISSSERKDNARNEDKEVVTYDVNLKANPSGSFVDLNANYGFESPSFKRIHLENSAKNGAWLELLNKQEKPYAKISAEKNGEGVIELQDKTGKKASLKSGGN